MAYTFAMGRDKAGRMRFRSAKVFDVHDWRTVHANGESLAFQPAWATFGRSLAWPLLVILIFGPIGWSLGVFQQSASGQRPLTPEQAARQSEAEQAVEELARSFLTDAEFEQIQERARYRREERRIQLERGREIAAIVYWSVTGAFGIFALLAPVSCLWRRTALARNVRGELEVYGRRLMPYSYVWPRDTFRRITCTVHEVWHRSRYSNHFIGWRWTVTLEAPLGEGGEVAPAVQFIAHQEKHDPAGRVRPPERVMTLVQWLRQVTGLPAVGPVIVPRSAGGGSGPVEQTMMQEGPREVRRFSSIEALPPHLQDLARQAREQGGRAERVISSRVTVQEADGSVRTYDSIDDVPPEVRARLEQMRRRPR